MSALRSAIESFTASDPVDLTDEELFSDTAELARAIDLLNHRLAAITNQVRLRGSYQLAGFLNMTRWLAVTIDVDNSTASRIVNLGKTLNANPKTDRQAASGDLSGARTRILARAASAHPDQYSESEAMLLELADTMALKDLRRAVQYWSNLADEDGAEKTVQQQRDDSYLHASTILGGMLKLDGLFDPETGEAILAALEAAMTPDARKHGSNGDLEPAPRRRAQALGHICNQYLNHHQGKIGRQRPNVSLIVDLDTLHGRMGKRCELERTGTTTPETARRILCDAEVTWIVTKDGVPLKMGRSQRTATPAQLKALAIRDGGCVHPGCDRPPAWCDAHHIVPWHLGGTTDLDNLELRCRRHHIAVHQLE